MKTHIALLMTALILVSGCATNTSAPGRDLSRMKTIANLAAYVGTVEYLKAHPEKRPLFVEAHKHVGELVANTNATPSDLAVALQNLPIDELRGPYGHLIVSTAVLLYDAHLKERVNLENNEYIRTVIVAVHDGIGSGLKQSQ